MKSLTVTVAGGGVLGSQIAFQSAFKGHDVTIWLRSEASIERAQKKIDQLRETYVTAIQLLQEKKATFLGILDPKQEVSETTFKTLVAAVEKAYQSIQLTSDDSQAFAHADFIIESIAENPQEKAAFYQRIAPIIPEKTIMATNSSTMLPSDFASYTGMADRYLALHFSNELWKNSMAEVMGHAETSEESYRFVVEFAKSIGLIPIELKKEQRGYILNSLLIPLLNAAEVLFANEVADPKTIDMGWKLGTGAPLGPFEILDIVGLTTAYNIVTMDPRSKDTNSVFYKIAQNLKQYIDQGRLGKAVGKGFYDYEIKK